MKHLWKIYFILNSNNENINGITFSCAINFDKHKIKKNIIKMKKSLKMFFIL